MAQNVSDMFMEKPVHEWDDHLKGPSMYDVCKFSCPFILSPMSLSKSHKLLIPSSAFCWVHLQLRISYVDVPKSIDVPDYYLTFAAIVSSAFTLTFNDSLVDSLAPVLLEVFGLEPELQDFLLNEYIPEVSPKSEAFYYAVCTCKSINHQMLTLNGIHKAYKPKCCNTGSSLPDKYFYNPDQCTQGKQPRGSSTMSTWPGRDAHLK